MINMLRKNAFWLGVLSVLNIVIALWLFSLSGVLKWPLPKKTQGAQVTETPEKSKTTVSNTPTNSPTQQIDGKAYDAFLLVKCMKKGEEVQSEYRLRENSVFYIGYYPEEGGLSVNVLECNAEGFGDPHDRAKELWKEKVGDMTTRETYGEGMTPIRGIVNRVGMIEWEYNSECFRELIQSYQELKDMFTRIDGKEQENHPAIPTATPSPTPKPTQATASGDIAYDSGIMKKVMDKAEEVQQKHKFGEGTVFYIIYSSGYNNSLSLTLIAKVGNKYIDSTDAETEWEQSVGNSQLKGKYGDAKKGGEYSHAPIEGHVNSNGKIEWEYRSMHGNAFDDVFRELLEANPELKGMFSFID